MTKMKRQVSLKTLFSIRNFAISIVLLGFVSGNLSCTSKSESLVEKADREALNQRSELSRYLYLQVIQSHTAHDEIRYRALKGLATVCLTQLFDYRTAVEALSKIFEEYSQVSRYENEIFDLRLKAAMAWRINLNEPKKALDVLSPLIPERVFRVDLGRELGNTYLALGDYKQAVHWFRQTYERAKEKSDCRAMAESQLSLVQAYSLNRDCEEALKWASVEFPTGCQFDQFAFIVEKAHCLELQGEINRAIALFDSVLKEEPGNSRAAFFRDNIKRRQKEKLKK